MANREKFKDGIEVIGKAIVAPAENDNEAIPKGQVKSMLYTFDDTKEDLYTTDAQLNTDYPDHKTNEGVFVKKTHQYCRKLDDSGSGEWSKQYIDEFETDSVAVTPLADVNSSAVQYKRKGKTIKIQGIIETNNITTKQDIDCFTLPIGFRPLLPIPICLPVSFDLGDYIPRYCILNDSGTFSINDVTGIAAVLVYIEFTL